MIPFLDLKAQYRSIKADVDAAIMRVIENQNFVLGPEVEAFESEFASFCQTKHAIGVNNGTSALHLALLAAGVGAGDEVITVSHTFVATVAAMRYVGARPVFVDIHPGSCNMDVTRIEAAITPRTKAILPVHLYGQCADMDPILEIAKRHGLTVIEDACQAHGALYKGKRAGSMGRISCFSFYPGKNLGAYGEGGAVVTNDDELAKAMRIYRDQGQSKKYHHVFVGYNYRLEAVQGAVLRIKLRRLDDWNAARRKHAATYRRLLESAPVRLLDDMSYGTPVWHIFPVFTPKRDALLDHMKAKEVATGIHYPIPVHLQPGFQSAIGSKVSLPITERAAAETLSLPMFAEMTDDQVAAVAKAVHAFQPRG